MRVGLILPGTIWFSPYVRIYTRILDQIQEDYSIISWNRYGDDTPEGYQYNVPCKQGHNSASLMSYWGYVKYVIKTVNKEKFDKLIVFGPQLTCLLSPFLLLKYKGRFMIDYRDLSIEQKIGFKQIYSRMLKVSEVNVVSSPGFLRCLPQGHYLISHNFDVNAVKAAIANKTTEGFNTNNPLIILTIGSIRDYSSNIEVIKALSNNNNVNVQFIGKGVDAAKLEEYCKKNNIRNVSFKGYYSKDEEPDYIKKSSFMNIFYPRKISHDTALSNRFYNSLIYKRPMIVTKNTTQGDYAEKYNVGISVTNCDNLADHLFEFLKSDYAEYSNRCNSLLLRFLDDQKSFEEGVISFIKTKR